LELKKILKNVKLKNILNRKVYLTLDLRTMTLIE